MRIDKHRHRHWHKWFAWFPVKVEGYWVWLEYVWRKDTGLFCSLKDWSYAFYD